MAIKLNNAILVDLDPLGAAAATLRIEGESITDRGPVVRGVDGDEVVDCNGAVVLPGLVNGHTHLYSALAVGMPPPKTPPRNFMEILRFIWWRLDQALDAESIEMSARLGAIEAVRCGTTTLIDHHASPNCIDGSLDLVQRGIADVGPRGVLCYETTDRHGPPGRDAGLAENRRFIEKTNAEKSRRFAGLVGAHASFTLEDDSLARVAALADECDTSVHIHVAEDPCDEADARRRNTTLLDRLADNGLLRPDSIFAHGTHLSSDAIRRVNDAGLCLAHNARSNMSNAVGYAPVPSFTCPVILGTDGIGADMLAEAQAAWFISRHQHAGLAPTDVLHMLANSARRASSALGITLGRLIPQAAADIIITDYLPATPVTPSNVAGHILFGLNSRHVRDVLIAGRWVMRDRRLQNGDEPAVRAASATLAADLWQRMQTTPPNEQSSD